MEFKGSPGPWSKKDWINDFALFDKNGNFIGCFDHGPDANLITSAPELLSALQGIQQSMAKYIEIANNIGMDVTADGFYLGHAMEVEEQAKAAINKALGRE